jgi:hypothetical protein
MDLLGIVKRLSSKYLGRANRKTIPEENLEQKSETYATDSQAKPTPAALAPCALGTSFGIDAQGPAGYLDGAERLGAGCLYLTDNGVGARLASERELLLSRQGRLPVAALDATLGAVRPGPWGITLTAGRARAASLDRAEAETAVAVARAAIALAAELSTPYVVLGLGGARVLGRLFATLRGKLLRGVLLYDDESAQELMAVRAALSRKYVDAAMRSLDRIVEEAARRGVTLLVRNPRLPTELPTPLELSALRAELRGAPMAPLFDLPAAHLTSTLHCVALRETVLAFGDGPLHCLADACGAVGGLVPGQGEVEVGVIARALPAPARRAFLPWPGLLPTEVAAGYAAVAAL